MTAAQKSYFDNHPGSAELHFASDGTPFFQKHDAESHAAGLKNKTVTTINRNEPVTESDQVGDELEHVITEADLEANPDLRGHVEVGETVAFSNKFQGPTEDGKIVYETILSKRPAPAPPAPDPVETDPLDIVPPATDGAATGQAVDNQAPPAVDPLSTGADAKALAEFAAADPKGKATRKK